MTAAVVLGLAAAYFGVRNLASLDPFAKYRDQYLNPFGAGVGSVMRNVGVSIYDAGELYATFDVSQVQIRRDQQFIRMTLLENGLAYDKGKEAASFEAGIALYDSLKGTIEVAGGPQVKTEDFTIAGSRVYIDQNRHTVTTNRQVWGTFKDGGMRANEFYLNYKTKDATLIRFYWKGPIEAGQADKKQKRDLLVKGERWEHYANPERDVYIDAEAIDQDSLIRATKIVWEKGPDVVTAQGQVEYHGPDAVITAPKVVVYRKEKRAIATGDVKVLIKPESDKGDVTSTAGIPPAEPNLPAGVQPPPKPKTDEGQDPNDPRSAENARKYPIIITCTQVEYFYTEGQKRAVMTGSPKARQDLGNNAWRELTAPKAVYEEEKELLTLYSGDEGTKDVRMKNNLGDDLVAETLIVSTKEGNEQIWGTRVEGVLKIQDEESKQSGGGSTGAGGGSKPPPRGGGGSNGAPQ